MWTGFMGLRSSVIGSCECGNAALNFISSEQFID
jgi:hypothetical protein